MTAIGIILILLMSVVLAWVLQIIIDYFRGK